VERGVEVSPFYDPLIAKVIVHARTRAEALEKLSSALSLTRIGGIQTNVAYLRGLLKHPRVLAGELTTRTLGSFHHQETGIEVLRAGTQTTVQDVPGRVGYWSVGIPPSGPMDPFSFRLANQAIGNPEGASGLEMTMEGPSLRFRSRTLVALGGADMQATARGNRVPLYEAVWLEAGEVLEIGRVSGPGVRGYLAVRGGIQTPEYLGSRSTFTLGNFGGHGGRALRVGDILPLPSFSGSDGETLPKRLPESLWPELTRSWTLNVLSGPHGAPDFFTVSDIKALFTADYEVHYNSARTGVRLIGPKPKWAREDGGEAGLHPSNIHDNAYAVGAIDFTGDMPILLGPDGPSLGGFVCPATVAQSELWKLGQLAPGDKVRFAPVSEKQALAFRKKQDERIKGNPPEEEPAGFQMELQEPVLWTRPESATAVKMVVRRSGDGALLVEFGPNVLDLNLRFIAHAFMVEIEKRSISGVIECTPGIRSLQVQFDATKVDSEALLKTLQQIEEGLGNQADIRVPSRIVHLPLSWDDPQTQLAARKYQQLVRQDAPWCPDNIEFIRRINGLHSVDAVREIVFGASYMVMGLGDVYLGAPVATPVDPRHRLVTTKYNPARTWTPENAVGIGGAYLCIYGMEGPGGYQFVGRTLPVYNRFRVTADFVSGKPWLLRFFDRLRFYPVGVEELLEMRADFSAGRHELGIEEGEFSLAEYNRFLESEKDSISEFKERQQAAFLAERQRWIESGQINFETENPGVADAVVDEIPEGAMAIESQIPANVWKIEKKPGDRVKRGETLLILESMKMEISVEAPTDGTLLSIGCSEGKTVAAGDVLFVLRPEES
jgi:urea carboxylase